MLSVELVRRGKVDSVIGLGNFQGSLPQPRGLVQPVQKVIPATLPVKTHRIVEQTELRRHLLTINQKSHVISVFYMALSGGAQIVMLRSVATNHATSLCSHGEPLSFRF